MEIVKINGHELAMLIMENSDAQLSDCGISVSDSGSLYFFTEDEYNTDSLGDDVVIFSYRHCDIDMGDPNDTQAVDEMVDWILDVGLNTDSEFDDFIVEVN